MKSTRGIEVVAIGTSTGGPEALSTVLPVLPHDFPVPVLVVQHMPPIFTQFLAERMSSLCRIPVHEATAGTSILPGTAWIAPGNFHMKIKRSGLKRQIELTQDPPENSCRPAVDVLFRSIADVYGAAALAVVMTGMGCDGVAGSRMIREKGGEVLVQDEATSVVWGMPGLVHASGQANAVLPLNLLGGEIVRRVLQSRAPHVPTVRVDPMALEPHAR